MRMSLYISPRSRAPEEQLPLIRLIEALCVEADEAGFAGIFLTEHHLSSHNPFQNSLQFASYLAARIKQCYLGLCTVNPALHQPLRLVEQCNLLDLLTEGRFVAGLGSGFVDEEYRAFGRDPSLRAPLLQQTIEVMMKLWAFRDGDEPFEYATSAESGRIGRAVTPSPYRRPHPILARATLTPATLLAMAERGMAALLASWSAEQTRAALVPYFAALEQSNLGAETVAQCREWTGLLKWVHVAHSDEQAQAELAPVAERWMNDHAQHGAKEIANPETAGKVKSSGYDARRALRDGEMICGSPATVARMLNEYADAGLGHFLGMFLRDLNEEASVRRSMRLFIDEVLPLMQ